MLWCWGWCPEKRSDELHLLKTSWNLKRLFFWYGNLTATRYKTITSWKKWHGMVSSRDPLNGKFMTSNEGIKRSWLESPWSCYFPEIQHFKTKPWKSRTEQRMVFGMVHIKDSLLPMGKVWSLDSLVKHWSFVSVRIFRTSLKGVMHELHVFCFRIISLSCLRIHRIDDSHRIHIWYIYLIYPHLP